MASPRLTAALTLLLVGAGFLVAWQVLERLVPARVDDALIDRAGRVDHIGAGRSVVVGELEPEAVVARSAVEADPSAPAEAVTTGPPRLPIFPVERARGELHVFVADELGLAAAGARVRLRSTLGGFAPGLEIGDDRAIDVERTTERDGRVDFADVPQGPYRLTARAAVGRRGRADVAFRAAADEVPARVVLVAEPFQSKLAILVVDRADRPIPGARVEVTGRMAGEGGRESTGSSPLAGVTDEEGRIDFPSDELADAVLLARAPDGRVGCRRESGPAEVEYDERDRPCVRVVVEPSATLVGRLVGVAPELSTCTVLFADLRTADAPHGWSWGTSLFTTVVNGSFRLEGLPAGRATLRLSSREGLRLVVPAIEFGGTLPNSAQPPVVELAPGELKEIELAVAQGATIHGIVRTSDGAPVVGALVKETFAPATSNFPDGFVLHGVNVWRFDSENEGAGDHPFTHATTTTDERGEYSLAGLQPGLHRIEVWAAGLALDRREAVAAADGATTELDHVLEPAGVLQGISSSDGYLGVTRVGAERPFAIAVLPATHAFTFTGLPAGDYALSQFHSDASVAPVEIARTTVVAGRTTWIDLTTTVGPHPITGRMFDGRGPIAGAHVGFSRPDHVTDAAGRFQIPRPFPGGGLVALWVELDGLRFLQSVEGRAGADGSLEVELRLGDERLVVTTDDGGPTLEGNVDVTIDHPVADAREFMVRASTVLDAAGRAKIDHLDPGSYRVTARFANGAARSEIVTLPRTEPLDLRPPPCGEVAVVVRDAAGRRVRAAQVSVAAWLGEGEIPDDLEGRDELVEWHGGYTDAAGRFVARGVRAGKIVVQASGPEGVQAPARAPESRLVLERDERRSVELTLPTRIDDRRRARFR